MPTRTPPVAAWTPAFVVDAVATAFERATELGFLRAMAEAARKHGVSAATIEEWVARARAVQTAPVPPGLLACHHCAKPMILVQLPESPQVYLCMPACGRLPVQAAAIGDAVAKTMLNRAPHLVPPGKTHAAAAYAPGAIRRIEVGATAGDLHITWRSDLPTARWAANVHRPAN
ncbi:hypothetical protein ACLQ24_00420 [Micromonospora sp. DT4]|uniref:hypothetical protein n=1 Tax=Micromonospora sp. DT4 TaxID=3393438 RepID=UPI003CEFF26C